MRGPNVMLGYLRAEHPGVLEPPENGWYDTGDIVEFDAEGFVTIKGRAKRFAKVAGEMVPLGTVEDFIAQVWPAAMHAVVTLPDAKRGEQLVLVTDHPDGQPGGAVDALRDRPACQRSSCPGPLRTSRTSPILGTGKIDYVTVSRLASELATAS